jgi:pSer/pThr/pTyr-binding forkhead associated (FHA) protein
MWKLTIEDEDGQQTLLPLAHDVYGVGRDESNAVRLTERNISRHHATIRKNGSGWVLEDLSSYNGTYVNGARISGEAHVASGDLIQLGDYRLELVDAARVTSEATAEAARAIDELDRLSDVPEVGQRPQRLVIVVGPSPGTEFPLQGEYFTIGRAEEASISINHVSISRIHAELIAMGGGRYEVVDKGSANGIRINGVELKRGILEAGDALELGDVRLRFVGKGKLFRAGADQSQELAALGGLGSAVSAVGASAAPESAPRKSSSKFVGIGAVVGGLIAIGLLVVALRPAAPVPSASQPTAAAAPVQDEGAALVEAARALAASGDLDGAHKQIGKIPDSSALLGDAAVRDLEAKWARAMFDRADASADVADKRRLLQEIAASETVDKDTRKKAADLLAAVSTETPPPAIPTATGGTPPEVVAAATSDRPSTREPPATPPPNTTAPPTPTAAAATAAKTATPSTPAAASPTAASPAAAPALSSYEKQRRALEPRVWSGKATEEEIRLLKAICSHMGDHACRNRAQAMLKQKQN